MTFSGIDLMEIKRLKKRYNLMYSQKCDADEYVLSVNGMEGDNDFFERVNKVKEKIVYLRNEMRRVDRARTDLYIKQNAIEQQKNNISNYLVKNRSIDK